MSDIDELLIEAKRVCGDRWQKAPEYPWEVAAQFGAEVERLRAERDNYKLGFESRCAMLDEYGAKVAKLEAANAELRASVDYVREERDRHHAHLSRVVEDNVALKKRSAWLERGGIINLLIAAPSDEHALAVVEALRRWERDNPKPSEGTHE